MCVISVYEQVIIKSDPLNLQFVNSARDPLYDPIIKERKNSVRLFPALFATRMLLGEKELPLEIIGREQGDILQ